MDFSKIRLNNERSSHVIKRRNRLSTWAFFKVLYRDNIWRVFGFSILMLIMIAPIIVVQYYSSVELNSIYKTLPTLNIYGFSTGVWDGANDYYQQQVNSATITYGAYSALAGLLTFVIFSGGFAVIRDAFWTGKLNVVGVMKGIGMGIAANFGYALVSAAILAFSVYGIVVFYMWLSSIILWLAIVLTVVLSLILLFVMCYLMILCSVAVTYKQSVHDNMDDAWRLMWMNILPNILHLIIALIPVGLYFLFGGNTTSIIFILFAMIILMFGGLYFPLVWQTFMMKTFALFHPVEVRKKKEVMQELHERERAEAIAKEEAAEQRKQARKNRHNKTSETSDDTSDNGTNE